MQIIEHYAEIYILTNSLSNKPSVEAFWPLKIVKETRWALNFSILASKKYEFPEYIFDFETLSDRECLLKYYILSTA